jgi:hypothetical protein
MPEPEVTTDPPICPFAACNAADNRDVVGRGRDFLYGTTVEETEIVRCPTCGMLCDETHKSQKNATQLASISILTIGALARRHM